MAPQTFCIQNDNGAGALVVIPRDEEFTTQSLYYIENPNIYERMNIYMNIYIYIYMNICRPQMVEL